MPTSSEWSVFHRLDGSKNDNFESLCNQLVWLHFSRYGTFKARTNQPGIEFDLKLTTECSLGGPGLHLGWQCKYHERNANNCLSSAAHSDIKHSLTVAERHYPSLKKWILWTPKPLSKSDQDWFYDIQSRFTLELWDDQRLDTLLQDIGTTLRKSYFGTLAANPSDLDEQHTRSVQPVQKRWMPLVHQNTDTENKIRLMLGDPEVLSSIKEQRNSIKEAIIYLENSTYEKFIEPTKLKFVMALVATDELLSKVLDSDQRRTLSEITSDLDDYSDKTSDGHERFIFLLRRDNHPDSLQMTNIIQDMRESVELIKSLRDHLTKSFIALIGSAGTGKTHLSAEIAGSTASRSSGVLLHGKWLRNGDDLDKLANKIVIRSQKVESFYELLSLLDGAAKRQKTRLPCLIDGLNEAENPKAWKDLLSQLQLDLVNFPNVIVIVTLRKVENHTHNGFNRSTQQFEEFADMALPDDCEKVELNGFDEDTEEAINKYFCHYKIESKHRPPHNFFSHPLNLRIFCETKNAYRKEKVIIEDFPRSIRSLFSKYVQESCERIVQFDNINHHFVSRDIKDSINTLAKQIWERGDRHVSEKVFLEAVGDNSRPWSIKRSYLLCQEGLILRDIDKNSGESCIYFSYDRLAGHLIATYLIKDKTTLHDLSWFHSEEFLEKIAGHQSKTHALSWDIFISLCTLLPEHRNGAMLWKATHPELQSQALILTPRVESCFIDEDTIEELERNFLEDLQFRDDALPELIKTLNFASHPLNADFFSRCMESLGVADRDLCWTEKIKGKSSYENHALALGNFHKLDFSSI